jgi:hypothetical protein
VVFVSLCLTYFTNLVSSRLIMWPQMTGFHSFYDWVIFYCIHIPHFFKSHFLAVVKWCWYKQGRSDIFYILISFPLHIHLLAE